MDKTTPLFNGTAHAELTVACRAASGFGERSELDVQALRKDLAGYAALSVLKAGYAKTVNCSPQFIDAMNTAIKKQRHIHGAHRRVVNNPPRKKGWTLVKYPKCFRHYIDMLRSPDQEAAQARQTGKSNASFWFRMSTQHAVMNSRLKNYPIFKDIHTLHEPNLRPVDRAVLCDKMISIYQFAE